MKLNRKDLLGIEDLSREEILSVLDLAEIMKGYLLRREKLRALEGKTVLNAFYEPSTRTRISFEQAGLKLGADVVNFSAAGTSVVKGESLEDTAWNLQALQADGIVIRITENYAPHKIAKILNIPVLNAGDGTHEHPTQGLLDLLTMRQIKGKFEGLKVVICGDIHHSRVARSNIWGLKKLGAIPIVSGPDFFIPADEMKQMGAEIEYDMHKAVEDADVVMALRIQFERQLQGALISAEEYGKRYKITTEMLKRGKKDLIIMHPGPINREVEISSEVADGPQSVILKQVANGVAVRMALLYMLLGGKGLD